MSFLDVQTNKDIRRDLHDWDINFDCKSIKLIYLNPGNTVGKHYHKNKDELFVLTDGTLNEIIIDNEKYSNVKSPACWLVPKGTFHEYYSDSKITLLCLASEVFNPKDDFEKK